MEKRVFKILMWIYLVGLLFFVILKFNGSFEEIITLHHRIIENEKMGVENINLVPFRTISSYMSDITEFYALKNIVGNILVFTPLGFLTSQVFNKKFLKSAIICTLSILFIECVQLIFKIGFFDVDDISLNLIGCLSGICISLFYNNIDKNKEK